MLISEKELVGSAYQRFKRTCLCSHVLFLHLWEQHDCLSEKSEASPLHTASTLVERQQAASFVCVLRDLYTEAHILTTWMTR